FNLTTQQKKIIVLGMDGREISPAEVYKAMNTEDRNIYDREVTALRKARLLVEIRTNPQATGIARRNKVPKAQVPRFKVQIPGVPSAAPKPRTRQPAVAVAPRRPRNEPSDHA